MKTLARVFMNHPVVSSLSLTVLAFAAGWTVCQFTVVAEKDTELDTLRPLTSQVETLRSERSRLQSTLNDTKTRHLEEVNTREREFSDLTAELIKNHNDTVTQFDGRLGQLQRTNEEQDAARAIEASAQASEIEAALRRSRRSQRTSVSRS